MTQRPIVQFNKKLDLRLERLVDVPPELVWEAWTKPEHLKKWFTPAPWTVADCSIDLRPGGAFETTMRSPEGQEFPSTGCFLEVVPKSRLVWTSALLPGFRPAKHESLPFTAIIEIHPEGNGTRYIATAVHMDEKGRDEHDKMGFTQGWGKALDQLVELAKTMKLPAG